MKVILIKDCKDGKVNQVVEVASGYATNFLIKKGYGLPFNKKTAKVREDKVATIAAKDQSILNNSNKAKEIIEKLTLTFKVKVTNMVVHGSITRKQVQTELKKHGLKLDNHAIENVKISSLGITKVKIDLPKGVKAKVKVEVIKDGN